MQRSGTSTSCCFQKCSKLKHIESVVLFQNLSIEHFNHFLIHFNQETSISITRRTIRQVFKEIMLFTNADNVFRKFKL